MSNNVQIDIKKYAELIKPVVKHWKKKETQAVSVIKLHQKCNKRSETPEGFYHEVRAEQVLNKSFNK